MIVLIFLVVVILNMIAMYIIIDEFLRKENICKKNSLWSVVAKVFSVIFNLALAYCVFWVVAFGIWFISTDVLFFRSDKIYISGFIVGMILFEIAVFLPYGLNLLLYKLWYRKVNVSKWWIFPSTIIGAGVFVVFVVFAYLI